MPTIVIYSDGACANNPGPGGWATEIRREDGIATTHSGGYRLSTNNRMELWAVVHALRQLEIEQLLDCRPIEVVTDSGYLVKNFPLIEAWKRRKWNTFGGGWQASAPVKNRDLWEQLDDLGSRCQLTLRQILRTAEEGNVTCDKLACLARKASGLPPDPGYHCIGPSSDLR